MKMPQKSCLLPKDSFLRRKKPLLSAAAALSVI
jgi:hypothetical protein